MSGMDNHVKDTAQPDNPVQPDNAPQSDNAVQPDSPVQTKNKGLGRILVAVYGVFALSAFARSVYQIATDFSLAPVAFSLSALAAVIYIVATVALALPGVTAWRVAFVAVIVEFVGVVAVSILSYISPELFPKASVWSHFGQGYGYVPFVLPVIGFWWLWVHRPHRSAA